MNPLEWFRKRRGRAPGQPTQPKAGPPAGAHGQRNIDGSYFAIWKCAHDHCNVGDPAAPPDRDCMECLFAKGSVVAGTPDPTVWTRATRDEAHEFIIGLEGLAGAYSGVGFRLL